MTLNKTQNFHCPLFWGEFEEYEKVISFPSKWVTASEPEYLVQITTQAWFKGQRYTVTEPVFIKNGIYLQR